MTTFKEEVTKLYAENSTTSANTSKFARALNILINTSLKGGAGFILEMIQNAEDAGATEISIRLLDGYLILEHNGNPFSMDDIREVCDFGHDQDTSKAEDIEKIGHKGIGFKAVFSVSDKVYIVTPQGTICFDKSHFREMKNIPWQVCPIITADDELPAVVKQNQQGHKTTIALKLKPDLNLSQEIQHLNNSPEILLFLNHVKQLRLESNDLSSRLEVSKTSSVKDTNTITLKRNNLQISRWFVMNSIVQLDNRATRILNDPNKDSTEYPDRIRNLKNTLVQFAARLGDEGHMTPCHGQFFAGLPTQVKTNALPVLVNGPNLLLDASRKQLQENEWNQYLLTQIPQLLIGWMHTLSQLPNHRLHVLSLLPMPDITTALPNSLQSSYKTGINIAKQRKSVPMTTGETTLSNAWIDDSGFMRTFPQFSTKDFVDPNLLHRKRLEEFHQANTGSNNVLSFKDICPQLEKYFGSDLERPFQQQLWRFLIAQTLSLQELPTSLVNSLRILGMDGTLHSVKNSDKVYIPSAEMSAFKDVVQFPLVHPALYHNAPDIEKFLGKVGVLTVSPEHIIRQHLIPALEKNSHPEQNVDMLTYIFKHYRTLTRDDFQKLQNAHVKTTKGTYLPLCQLYLSDIYDPEIRLEKSAPDAHCFIAADYLAIREIPWRKYFVELGAAENFKARMVTYTKEQADSALGGGREYAQAYIKAKYLSFSGGTAISYTIPMIELITDARYRGAIWRAIHAYASNHPTTTSSDYIKFYLQNAPACLASDGKHYPSLSLLSDGVSALVKSTLPHATLPVKAHEYPLTLFLEMRVKPTAAEWMKVLDELNNNKSRNIEHYQEVLQAICVLAASNEAEVKALTADWRGALLAENGTLQSVRKLHYYATNHFIMRPTANWLMQVVSRDSSKIAELFSITKIDHWGYDIRAKNPKPDSKIMERITYARAISILAFVENMGKEYDHHKTVNEMHQILSGLKLTVADEISITQKNDESGKVLQTTDFVRHFGNELTYTHSASSPFVAPEFAKVLKERLRLNNPHMDRILTMFISYDYVDFTIFLEQFFGYNQADVPSAKIDKPKEKERNGSGAAPGIYIGIPARGFSSAAGFSNAAESSGSGFREVDETERATMPAAEKARLFQFVSACKLGPKGVIFEGDIMDFEDITDKVRLYVLQEVRQYNRKGKSHEWGRGAVFQHLLQHYMIKFSPDMKVAEMQSTKHIRFMSSDHRKVIDVEWCNSDDKTSKKDVDGDIHVTKRTFNKEGELTYEKVNKISVRAPSMPKQNDSVNPNLTWSKSKKEACRLNGDKSRYHVDKSAIKQEQTSVVKVSF